MDALRLARIERVLDRWIEETEIRRDRYRKSKRHHVFEAIDDVHALARDAEFFLEFAQRGGTRVAVLRIDDAAGKGDLARVAAQMVRAPDEDELWIVITHHGNDDGSVQHPAPVLEGWRGSPQMHVSCDASAGSSMSRPLPSRLP